MSYSWWEGNNQDDDGRGQDEVDGVQQHYQDNIKIVGNVGDEEKIKIDENQDIAGSSCEGAVKLDEKVDQTEEISIPDYFLFQIPTKPNHPDPFSPTAVYPSSIPLPGELNFQVTFPIPSQIYKTKNWDFSVKLNKLFVDMNKWVEVKFYCAPPPTPQDLYIRALPVYTEAADLKLAVLRCPNHSRLEDPTNAGFLFPRHLIRMESERSMYCEDLASGRLSVLAPLDNLQQGDLSSSQLIKFMCLGSDVGGINRRAIRVIFTLEDNQARTLGRQVVEVRICCCPRRDRAIEEERVERLEVREHQGQKR